MAKIARESKNEFDEIVKPKSVSESFSAGSSYEMVTNYPYADISTTRITSVNPQPASGRLITWDDTKFSIGICYFDEQFRYLGIYDIWKMLSPYTCRDYPYMSITIRKLDNTEIIPSEISDAQIMLANVALPYEPYGATIWKPCVPRVLKDGTDTFATLPAKIYTNDPQSKTVTLGINGNTVQNGTPTPDAPVAVEGCGVRTENLFSSVWEQGSISSSTGQNEESSDRVRTKGYIEVIPNKIYSFSRSIYNAFMNVRFYSSNKSFIGIESSSSIRLIAGGNEGNPMPAGVPFCCFEIIDTNIKYMRIGDQSNDLATKYMMVEGEYTYRTMPGYEPYGYKIPVTLGSQTQDIYLGTTTATLRIKKLVLDGTKNVTDLGDYYNCGVKINSTAWRMGVSTIGGEAFTASNNGRELWAKKSYFPALTTAADFKSYLQQQYAAGTPVTVWYILAAEESTTTNEPLMKIGNYADSVSLSFTDVAPGEKEISVNTSVQPSSVAATHYGWHEQQELIRQNGEWTTSNVQQLNALQAPLSFTPIDKSEEIEAAEKIEEGEEDEP